MRRLAYFLGMLLIGLALLSAVGFACIDSNARSARSFATLFFVALGASLETLVVARLAWSGWTSELERALSGDGDGAREFQPLLRDLRSLLDSGGVRERDANVSRRWDPQRLRCALTKHLRGERVIILANREPYLHEKTETGVKVRHPASGLVTALEPVMRACSGVWIGHGSGSADRETVDAQSRVRVPPGEESYCSEFNVYRWAGRMLVDAAELRRRKRMSGRLAKSSVLQRFKSA